MKSKIIKIVLSVVIIAVAVTAIVFGVTKLTEKKPADSVKNFVESLKNGDFELARTYTSDDTMDALEIDTDAENLEMMKLYFKNLNVNILEITKSKEQSIVKIEVTNKNLGTILQNYIQKALELAMANIDSGKTTENMEAELMEFFKSQFDSGDIDSVTTTVDVILNNVDGKWKVVIDEILRDALLPGLSELSDMYSLDA